MISAAQVLNLYKRLGGMGRTIKPTLHPGDVLIFNKCLVHRFKLVNVNMKISSINQCGGEYYRLYFTASPPQTPKMCFKWMQLENVVIFSQNKLAKI